MQPQSRNQLLPSLGQNGFKGRKVLPHIDNSMLKSELDSDSEMGSNIGFKPLRKVRKGYELASYDKAVQSLHTQSYYKKVTNDNGQAQYQPYESCIDSKQLKQYGLGVYLYLQFVKRLAITLLIMSCILSIPIVYCYMKGKALQNYTQSYMITMAKMSLGNIENGNQETYMFITVCDILSMIVLFVFYLHWRSFHEEAVESEEKDHTIVNPTSYVLSVVGFSDGQSGVAANLSPEKLQANLVEYFDKTFNGAYEIQVVYNYAGNFSKFVTYDELIEKKEKEKQVMNQTDKDNQDFLEIQREIRELEDELSQLSQTFEPMYAIIHFRTLKARNNYVNFCRKYSLVDKFSYNFKRFICCTHNPPREQLFMGTHALKIKQLNLSRPEQINWSYLDVSSCSRVIRWTLSILGLIIAILITSSLIALCTLYVSSTSACVNYDSTTLLADASDEGGQKLYCFCAANFAQILTDTQVEAACGDLSNTILLANIMQVGASLASAVSNLILIIIVSLIAKHILKPDSKPKEYSFVFVGVFLSNYINASVLPLVMNGNIFGFESLQYLTFIDFIDFNKVAVFQDFDTDWYAVVAPYYMNFLIIASLTPIGGLLAFMVFSCWTHSRVKKACEKNDPENPIIQKEANNWLASLIFDLPTQQALVCLYFFMTIMYSSMIPVLVPITTFGTALALICKKQTLLRYSLRVPADQALSQKTITLIPLAILAHYLMGVWSHTSEGVFASNAFIVTLDQGNVLGAEFDRVLLDVPMLAALGLIILWILFEYTLLSLFRCLMECCLKDDLEVPVQFASVENKKFSERIKNANVLGSYKIVNSPTYGHAIKAFKQLKRKIKKQQLRSTMKASNGMQNLTQQPQSPQKNIQQKKPSSIIPLQQSSFTLQKQQVPQAPPVMEKKQTVTTPKKQKGPQSIKPPAIDKNNNINPEL